MNFGSEYATKIVYLSYFHLYDSAGDKAAQVKLPRLTSDDQYNGAPSIGITHQDSVSDSMFYANFGEFNDKYTPYPTTSEWHRYEYLGNIEQGYARYDNDLALIEEYLLPVYTSGMFGRLAVANVHQMGPDTIGVYDYYFDNIYLSDTWARIEIGNNISWNNCTQRTVIPFESWKDNEIKVPVKSEYLGFDGPYYIFVVDYENNPSEGLLIDLE